MEDVPWQNIVIAVVLLLVGNQIVFWRRMWGVPEQNKETKEAVRRVEETVNEVRLRVNDMSSSARHPPA